MAPPGRAFNGSGPGWATVWPSIAVGAWSCLVPTPGPCTPCNWEPLRGLLGSMGDGVLVVGSAVLGDLGRVAAVGVAAPPTSMLELQQHLCVPLQTPLIPGRPKRRVAKIERLSSPSYVINLINERRRRHGLQATVTCVLCEFQGTASAPSVLLQLINEEAREWAVTGYRHLQSLLLLRVLLCSFLFCRAAACVIAAGSSAAGVRRRDWPGAHGGGRHRAIWIGGQRRARWIKVQRRQLVRGARQLGTTVTACGARQLGTTVMPSDEDITPSDAPTDPEPPSPSPSLRQPAAQRPVMLAVRLLFPDAQPPADLRVAAPTRRGSVSLP
ncbi:unnamed protein product [Miscanthus lutarioriparius]|uniref:Uncharacterized protein n=1 Tax=Miscanthus lutarioriparius TaxID=422564 RepID=A0A811Q0L2_9POAL|nr:unnamed protein product [Miscanthus lutarioriparius]